MLETKGNPRNPPGHYHNIYALMFNDPSPAAPQNMALPIPVLSAKRLRLEFA